MGHHGRELYTGSARGGQGNNLGREGLKPDATTLIYPLRLKQMRLDAASGGGFGGIPRSAYFVRQTLYNSPGNNKCVNSGWEKVQGCGLPAHRNAREIPRPAGESAGFRDDACVRTARPRSSLFVVISIPFSSLRRGL